MCVCVGHAGQTDPQASGKHPTASDNKSPADYFFFVLFICIYADALLVQANHYSDGYTSTDGQF